MLEHLNPEPLPPSRVVILGARGFIGAASAQLLLTHTVPVLALGRAEADLLAAGTARRLAAELRPDDAVVVISADAPCKDAAMLADNIRMMECVCQALAQVPVAHVVYVSSDAVYRDSREPLTEDSCAEPGSLHGAMHLARELMLKSVVEARLAVLRPTLVYGAADPHNGYGPNRFRRLAAAGQEIVLFGEGEEQRDHVLVDDVAEIVRRVLMHRSRGVLNAATGRVHSFRAIAERIAAMYDPPVAVRGAPRQGPMPHGGYRAFDAGACLRAFPDFRYTDLETGLIAAMAAESQRR
ncbi:MAG TPA: NAD-dependent epimerase/dehydratase family protein [Xanthobacteraceae bacterium]|jgi:nucleoside-diphosphate-sugar epimerase